MHVVCYEKLQANLSDELLGALNFLNKSVPQEMIKCTLKNSGKSLIRPHADHRKEHELYSEDMYEFILENISHVLQHLERFERPSLQKLKECVSQYKDMVEKTLKI